MPTTKKKLKHALQANLGLWLFKLLARFPLKTTHALGKIIGKLFYLLPNRNLRISRITIDLCFPELTRKQRKQLVKTSLLEAGKTLTEAAPMWLWDKTKVLGTVKKVYGEEHLTQALEQNNGVILALPHLGNWELIGLYCSSRYPTTSMYQKPKLEKMDEVIKSGRERLGAKLVPADNSGVRAMLNALKQNGILCVLPDQEPNTGTGVYAPFFNIAAYSSVLVPRLAQKTGAKIIIAYAIRLADSSGYDIYFVPLVNDKRIYENEIADAVAYLNRELEKNIRQYPEQYQWSYKRFRHREEGLPSFY